MPREPGLWGLLAAKLACCSLLLLALSGGTATVAAWLARSGLWLLAAVLLGALALGLGYWVARRRALGMDPPAAADTE